MSFFEAPWHIVILLFAALLLFGSSRLPGAAKALGSSMNIFKKAVKGEDDAPTGSAPAATVVPPPAQLTSAPPAAPQQAAVDDLQRQLQELQRQQAMTDARPGTSAPTSEAQPHGQTY